MHAIDDSPIPLYQMLVDSVEDYAIFALDRDGNVISWNPGAARFKGYTASEIKGQNFSVFYPPEDLQAGKPELELETATRLGRYEDEGWRVRKDGSRFWANVVITPLRTAGGELVGFAKVTRDLTGRRAAEERVRQLLADAAARAAVEQKNRELEDIAVHLQGQAAELEAQKEEAQALVEELEESNNQLIEALIRTEEARRAADESEEREREARRRAESLQELTVALSFAATSEAVADAVISSAQVALSAAGVAVCRVGDSGEELELVKVTAMPEEVQQAWSRIPLASSVPLADAVTRGEPVFLESLSDWQARYPSLVHLTATVGHKSQAVVPLVVGGKFIGSLGFAFTEERTFSEADREHAMLIGGQCAIALERARLFEAERAARRFAENANRAKGEFLAAMSHELRTPLNAISGHIDLLSMELYGPLQDQQQEALQRIKRAEQHLLRLIDDLLSFARIEGGKVEYRVEAVAVAQVLADVAPMIDPQVSAKGLTFEVQIPDDAPIEVTADREKLVQIVLNLLSNAVKFTPSGGSITVSVRRFAPASQPADFVHLCIQDTGIGIPDDKLQAVFDPFVQLATSHSQRHEGTGLGLAISRDLARGMGGDLQVESEAGKGATFIVVLPLASLGPAGE